VKSRRLLQIPHNRQYIHLPRHLGDRVSDKVSASVGSWPFIIVQSIILAFWIILNSLAFITWKWDPAPFILLNLCLSFQAAFTAPIIMISQNRQAAKDHVRDEHEAVEVEEIFKINSTLMEINRRQLEILELLHPEKKH